MAAFDVEGVAARDSSGVLAPFKFTRREPASSDVLIKILFCGICHSDLHQIKNDWSGSVPTIYPVVPGHEITGLVVRVGDGVRKFKAGDRVGVGCMVSSCGRCGSCDEGLENYCSKLVFTYNTRLPDGSYTFGGFSTHIVVEESFVLLIPANLPLDSAAPLLCAGITIFSPMKFYGIGGDGKKLGVVGLGGLGHIAVKLGKAMGMKVTVISTSASKENEAKGALGADDFLLSKDAKQMKAAAKTLDFIVDTVSAQHPLEPLLSLLKLNGKLVLVGLATNPMQFSPLVLSFGRKMIGGSFIGSIKETQEMLDFCSEHNVTATIEKIGVGSVNNAMERLEKSDVKYRFVIDMEQN